MLCTALSLGTTYSSIALASEAGLLGFIQTHRTGLRAGFRDLYILKPTYLSKSPSLDLIAIHSEVPA